MEKLCSSGKNAIYNFHNFLILVIFLLGAVCLILYGSCSSSSHFVKKWNLPGDSLRAAVFPFSGYGQGITLNLRQHAADQLTTLLFLKNKMLVVDRSQVNHVIFQHRLESLYHLSGEELTVMADSLGASVIVLGLIENHSVIPGVENNRANYISVTLRFLDGESGKVIGMVFREKRSKNSPREILDALLSKMVMELDYENAP